MNLICKSQLNHPKLLTVFIVIVGILGGFSIINAILNANSYHDFVYASIPFMFAAGIYEHSRYPTKLGWLAIAFLLLTLSIIETIGGLMPIYFDIGVKYSWQSFTNILSIDMVLLLVVFGFIYITKVTKP
jgi:hypothetical protein